MYIDPPFVLISTVSGGIMLLQYFSLQNTDVDDLLSNSIWFCILDLSAITKCIFAHTTLLALLLVSFFLLLDELVMLEVLLV